MTPSPAPPSLENILAELQSLSSDANRAGMARFGINTERAYGVPVKELRRIAKGIRSHALALALWDTGIHEARILASIVDDPRQVTREQMEAWAAGFDSWDIVDQVCGNLFDRTADTEACIRAWAEREEEFVRRAAFSLIAYRVTHAKKLPESDILPYLELIQRHATDPRNFVKKAVNWALRTIGKRSPSLREAALQTAYEIRQMDSPAARWIANDAIRELESRV